MAFSFDLGVMFEREGRLKRRSKKRRRDICCKSHELLPEIPFDLIIDILTRLPGKSLMRFKSVSKLWSSLICSKSFTNLFIKVSSSSQRLYLRLGYNNSLKDVLLSSLSTCPGSDVHSFLLDQDLTIPAMEGYFVTHVYRGLMCLQKGRNAQIYNTTTRQLVVLPSIEVSKFTACKWECFMYTTVHDGDRYKVVCTVNRQSRLDEYISEHWVLLLGGDVTSKWRKICSQCPLHSPITQGLSINGSMHYVAWVDLGHYCLVGFNIGSEEISTFTISPEDISTLRVHEDFYDWFCYFTELVEYGGRVALVHHNDYEEKSMMKLLIMEDAKNNRWSSKTLVLHPSQMHIVNEHSLTVQGRTRNGELIWVPEETSLTRTDKIIGQPVQETTHFHVFLYNLENNHMRKVEIKITPNRYDLIKNWDVIGFDDIENLMNL